MRGGGGRLLSLALALAFAACCVAGHGVHPLSRIAIHRARVALDSSAAVRASPKLLGSRVRTYILFLHFPPAPHSRLL